MSDNYLDRFTTAYVDSENYAQTIMHVHNLERWFGSTAGVAPAVAMPASLDTPYVLTAAGAANTFGNAVAIINGAETLSQTAFQTEFDFHRLIVTATSGTGVFVIRFAFNGNGEANFAAAVANFHYTYVTFTIATASDRQTPVDMMSGRITRGATGKVWAALACNTGGRTASFLFGIHSYPSRPNGLL